MVKSKCLQKKTVEQKTCWKHYHLPWRGITALYDITKDWLMLHTFSEKWTIRVFLSLVKFILYDCGKWEPSISTELQSEEESSSRWNMPTHQLWMRRGLPVCVLEERLSTVPGPIFATKTTTRHNYMCPYRWFTTHSHQSDWVYRCSLTILFLFFFLPLEGDRGKALDLLTGYTRIIRDCKELEKQIVFFFVSFKNRPCVCP